MKRLIFIVFFATTAPSLFGMTGEEKTPADSDEPGIVRFHEYEDDETNKSDTVDVALPETIPELVQDLKEHGTCSRDNATGRYRCKRDHDILLLLIHYKKPKNNNDENLVDCLKTIFDYVRSIPGLEKVIAPKLVADIIKYLKISVNETNKDGLTLLHDASFIGDAAVVETLCLADADVRVVSKKHKWGSLHIAADKGHGDACRVLIEHKAPVSAQTTTLDTPLHFAAENGHESVCEILKAAGADMRKTNSLNRTPGRMGRKYPTLRSIFKDLAL